MSETRTEYPSSVGIENDSKDQPHPSTKIYCEAGHEMEAAIEVLRVDAFMRQQLGLPPRIPYVAPEQ